MNFLLKNKKAGGVPIAIVILVLAILLVVMSSLVLFKIRGNNLESEITSGSSIGRVYADAEILNFYLREICSNISLADNPVEKFKTELARYKDDKNEYVFSNITDMTKIEPQINGEHIKVEGDILEVNLDVNLNKTLFPYGSSRLDSYLIIYDYKFNFERNLSQNS